MNLWDKLYGFLLNELAKPKGKGVAIHMELGSGYDKEAEDELIRQRICNYCRLQEGEPYQLGVENDGNPDPDIWDCSELVQQAYAHCNLVIPDGSNYQYDFCRSVINPMPGDLGFLWSDAWGRIGHVVVYIGQNEIIEARGGSVKKVRIAPRHVIETDIRFRGWRSHPDLYHAEA